MEDCRETEQYNEDYRGNLRGMISVQNIGIWVIERRTRLVFGHVDCDRT
jgi:hypothetical protein